MKDILQFQKVFLVLIVLAISSSCSEPAPVKLKTQNKISESKHKQTIPTCCSKKPNRFAIGAPAVKLNK